MKKQMWAQWSWSDTGPGRWHRVVDVGIAIDASVGPIPAVLLQCGRARPFPTSTQVAEAPGDTVCPKCIDADADADEAVLVTIGADHEALPDRPPVPDVFLT